MVFMILGLLAAVLLTAIGCANSEPMPLDMEDEDDRRSSRTVLVYNEWNVHPVVHRPLSDRLAAKGGQTIEEICAEALMKSKAGV